MAANDSAWAADDTMEAERLNREWILGRLFGPIFDTDDALTITATSKPLDGALIAGTIGDHYTVGSIAVAVAHSLKMKNSHSAAVAVTLYIVESGGSAGVANCIWADNIEAGESVEIKIPYFMAAGDKIRAVAGTANVVSLRGELLEIKTLPAGLVFKTLAGAALTTSYVAHYTHPGGSIKFAYLLATTTCNTHSAALVPNIAIVPSGGSPGTANEIFGDSVVSKETVFLEPFAILESGDSVQAKAGTGALMGHRITVLEAA